MQFSVTRKFLGVAAVGTLLASVTLGICVGDGSEPSLVIPASAPVSPVVPAPLPPSGHHIRYQDLIPNHVGKVVGPGNLGILEPIEESGAELSLGECIAVALERQPSLKAVKASIASTEQGYRALMHFGTVGTLFSPDLEIRKQQAQRGFAATAGEYQKAHNEVIQDVTRLYYTAVYAKQQGSLADDMVGTLTQYAKIIEDILNNKKLPASEIGGLNMGKLRVVQIGVITAKQLQSKAAIGRNKALAALRQVM